MSLSSSSVAALKRLNVIYVDKSLVVLNKPAGLSMQGTVSLDAAKRVGTIQPIMEELQAVLGQKEPLRTIHRLDKDTTGVILLARNPRIVTEVHKQMSSGQAQKTYFALVNDSRLRTSNSGVHPIEGRVTSALRIDPNGYVSLDSGELISRDTVGSKIKPSRTAWRILASSASHQTSLMELVLETGYKHQLRVHMSQALACPILGDTKYGGTSVPESSLALHCRTISLLRYKKEGPKKRFTLSISAALPPSFVGTCQKHGITLAPGSQENIVELDGEPCPEEQLLHYTGGSLL